MNPYADDALVERLTREVMARGKRLFQIHRLAASDSDHVAALLAMFEPPKGATVLDLGCGIGEVARLMQLQRPDLRFILLNISPAQLGMCPDLPRVAGDMNRIPLAPASVDCVMIVYALGHGDMANTLRDVARVLRRGGTLFIYDLASVDGAALWQSLNYRAWRPLRVLADASDAHLSCSFCECVGELNCDDYSLFNGPAEFARIFDGVWPIAYRFTKGD